MHIIISRGGKIVKIIKSAHDFDEINASFFLKETTFSLWGAANIGQRFLTLFEDKLNICHVYDGDIAKVGQNVGAFVVESPEEIKYDKSNIIVVTCSFFEQIAPQMEKIGYKKNIDLFNYEEFEKIYWLYQHNFLRSTRIDISLTEKCTLKCEKCNMFMPYFKNPKDQSAEAVKADIDSYFEIVDWVKYVNLLGGEPFIYPYLTEVLEYLGEAYRNRIERIVLFTNGMIIPNENILAVMKKYNVFVQFSDYTKVISYNKKLEEFNNILDEYGIDNYTMQSDIWGDFGFPDNPNNIINDEEATSFFDKCNPPFRGLWNNRVYFCHLEASAVRAGLFEDKKNDYIVLNKKEADIKKKFLEFDFGHLRDGHLEFCKVCRGCGCVNDLFVPAALQKKIT